MHFIKNVKYDLLYNVSEEEYNEKKKIYLEESNEYIIKYNLNYNTPLQYIGNYINVIRLNLYSINDLIFILIECLKIH